jgi:hypothetical protein
MHLSIALTLTAAIALSAAESGHNYIDASRLPAYAAAYASVLGPELRKGSERLIWRGTLSRAGRTAPFHFTRELDDHMRLDISGAAPKILLASSLRTASPVFTSRQSREEEDLLETLADDSPESFLLGLQNGLTTRWLGSGVSIAGINCDVYARRGPIDALPEKPIRDKLYYFDSASRLFLMSRYEITDSAGRKSVEVRYQDWISENGRQRPRAITRTENGATVLAVRLAAVESTASQNDGLFSRGSK